MADDVEYAPDANVSLWVNIVIPIISEGIFVYIFFYLNQWFGIVFVSI